VLSGKNVWAVGNSDNNKTLIVHWDGTAWQRVPSPCHRECHLDGVVAISARNAWAVGSAFQRTLILHWNGVTWATVPSPTPRAGGYLYGVAALSARDLWAVGRTNLGALSDVPNTIIDHWNSTCWSSPQQPCAAG
jgi:hypothetical protein